MRCETYNCSGGSCQSISGKRKLREYAAECEAVEAARAVFADGGEVGEGAVAFVAGEAVLGKLGVVRCHYAVAVGFGDHRGSGDRCRDRTIASQARVFQRSPRDTAREVNDAWSAAYRSNQAKARGIKVLRAKYKIWVVQQVDKRRLQFQTDSFPYLESFNDTYVHVEIEGTIDAVQREIPKRSRRRGGH